MRDRRVYLKVPSRQPKRRNLRLDALHGWILKRSVTRRRQQGSRAILESYFEGTFRLGIIKKHWHPQLICQVATALAGEVLVNVYL